MEIKEKAFPRGGKKPALFKSKRDATFSLFRKPKFKPKKKSKKPNHSENENSTVKVPIKQSRETLNLRIVEDLKASFLQDGMLVLGIVSQVSEKIVNVSLPGRLRGVINIANVSEHYKSMIENIEQIVEVPSLKEIFQEGDVLPVKILSVSEEHSSLMLTSDPKAVNQKLSYSLIEEGFVLVGSVKSKEDHGYIVDFGLENVNGFLLYEKVEPDKNLHVGQLVRCCVMQCNKSPGSCSLQLSMLKEDLQSVVIKKDSTLPIYCYVPGFQFEVTVKKKLIDGVEVNYSKENSPKGYIYEDHLLPKFPDLSNVELESESIATLLYVKPLINFLYFKIMPKKQLEWPFKYGEIVSGKVIKVRKSGIVFKVINGTRKAKCFVPISKLKNKNELEDKSAIVNLYPVGKKVLKIRLGNVNHMGRFYLGATDKATLSEKYYSVSDLKCGEIINCKIISFGKSSARLEIGRTVTGMVGFGDMSDVPMRNPASKFKIGQKVKARVREVIPEKRFVRLTMKPTLLKDNNLLCNIKKIEKDKCYVGTVLKVMPRKLKVAFFNEIIGIVPQHLTPYHDSGSLTENFYPHQLVKCSVVSVEDNGVLCLSLLCNDPDVQLEIGKKYKAKVANLTKSGMFLDVFVDKNKKCKGYLPAELLTVHHGLASAFFSTYFVGDKLTVYCLSNDIKTEVPVFGAAEIFNEFYEGRSEEDLEKELTVDSVVPFLFRNKSFKTNTLFLTNLIPGKKDWGVRVIMDDLPGPYTFCKYQLVYGKILKVGDKKMDVSIKLSHVWTKDFHISLGLLNSYLKAMETLVTRQKNKLEAYNGNLSLGCSVKGIVEEVRTSCAVVRMETGDLGLIEGKFTEGQEVNGKVVWIDGPEQMIHIIPKNSSAEETNNKGASFLPENDNLRGKVVFISNEVVVVELKGRGNRELAFVPRKRHLNDFLVSECVFAVGEELKIWITRKDSNYLLGMDRRIVSLQEKIIWRKSEAKLKHSVQSLKRKLESEKMDRKKKRRSEPECGDVEVVDVKLRNTNEMNNEDAQAVVPEIKEEVDVEGEVFITPVNGIPRLEYDDVDIKSETGVEDEEDKEKPNVRVNNEERIMLSSSSESEDEEEDGGKATENSKAFEVGFNWQVLNNHSLLSGIALKKDELSDDDDDDESKNDKKKKRRLTASEKREKAKSEEERLRFVEERLMDANREPETADDFDRAVLSNPDSSALWLKYMAFHIQGTEIEKARAVAKRALKAISFREEQEKLNIWIALLNLENMYGNEESLNKTLSEALQSNEPYKIHLHMLNVHGQGNKLQDMEKLGNFMLKKYKDVGNMWHEVASAYFSVGKVESARNVLQKALTVVDKSHHVPIISKFAHFENKYGSPERAQTLYESILASYPKRVDIWSCYVDMLVKSNHIDLARQVLERATCQSLRPRKMKILFKKFMAFEESHGTPENVEKVREAAVEYVQTVGVTED